jgi:hypothetical protein
MLRPIRSKKGEWGDQGMKNKLMLILYFAAAAFSKNGEDPERVNQKKPSVF